MRRGRTTLVGVMLVAGTLVAWSTAAAGQSGCRSGALPACGAPEPAPVAAPTADALAAGDWRLLSPVFAALPPGGYPIAFRQGGAVQTVNLAGVTGWSMPAAGRLELTGGGRVLYGFRWDERHGAFRHVIAGGTAAGLSMVIVPAGLEPLRAAAAMEEWRRGEVDPALLPALLRAPAPVPVHLAGARVSSPGEAVNAAVEAYFARAGGLRALQSAQVVGAASLGFDVPDFASAGDRVWEVRVYERGTLSAVIWVNAETGRPRFLAPP
jgi:hypothetical protein